MRAERQGDRPDQSGLPRLCHVDFKSGRDDREIAEHRATHDAAASRASISSIVSASWSILLMMATAAKQTATARMAAMATSGPDLTAATTFWLAAIARDIKGAPEFDAQHYAPVHGSTPRQP